MNSLIERLLGDAARLTRAGKLQDATAAIQAALRGTSAVPATPTAHAPTRGPACAPAPDRGDAEVIDVEAREVFAAAESVGVQDHASALPPAPRAPAAASAPSPAAEPNADRFIRGTHIDAAGQRDYKLYVPPNVRGRALPLVVMLHGCTQNPDDFAAGTGMNDEAREQGFFVLYPAQAQGANAQRCWNWFDRGHQQRGRGEPALLAAMTRAVIDRYGIDPGRVYVAGLSAGGAMAAILGDTYPELFAAVGVHSGLPPGAASSVSTAFSAMRGGPAAGTSVHGLAGLGGLRAEPSAPARNTSAHRGSTPPTIVFHGDRDTTVHPVNGERVVAACVESANDQAGTGRVVAHAVEHERHSSSQLRREYTQRAFRNQRGRVLGEHWVVHGCGHAWSGGSALGSYTDPEGPSATREMLRFFFECTPAEGGQQAA